MPAGSSRAHHLGKVQSVRTDAFTKAMSVYIADKTDEKVFDFGVYNSLSRSQGLNPAALAKNIEFAELLVRIFPTGRALPTYLQNSVHTLVDLHKARSLAGKHDVQSFALWFAKRCQVFLAHLRWLQRNGMSEFQKAKLQQEDIDSLESLASSLVTKEGEASSGEEEEETGAKHDKILMSMWQAPQSSARSSTKRAVTPAPAPTSPKKRAPAAHIMQRPAAAIDSKKLLSNAQAVAKVPVKRGSLKIAKKPAGPSQNVTEMQHKKFGRTKLSHYSRVSYIQHYEDKKWKSLCNFMNNMPNRKEVAEQVWQWLARQGSGVTKDMILAKKASLLSGGEGEKEEKENQDDNDEEEEEEESADEEEEEEEEESADEEEEEEEEEDD